jgi:hypothetical protein
MTALRELRHAETVETFFVMVFPIAPAPFLWKNDIHSFGIAAFERWIHQPNSGDHHGKAFATYILGMLGLGCYYENAGGL